MGRRRGAALAAVAVLVLAAPAGAARVAYLRGGDLVVLDLASGSRRVVLAHAATRPVRWSGDGRLVSVGGRIAGGPTLPASELSWARTGETAAWVTRGGGVETWSPSQGRRSLVRDGWGAQRVAWGPGGRLAIGRTVCRVPCGEPTHHEVWVWSAAGGLRRVVRLDDAAGVPMPVAWDGARPLWWEWPNSGSIAADGVSLYAGATRLAAMLMYPDWIASCGGRLALAVGGDRNSMHGKSIALGGRDVSRDPSRSWVSPACSRDGSLLVASAGRDDTRGPWGREHRAIWQLLPVRRQLTHPPAGWTDEFPQVLGDGSLLFVRTRQTSVRLGNDHRTTTRGTLERLAGGASTALADLSTTTMDGGEAIPMYYGHYWWPTRLAVSP